ncbi:hypothetical protein RBSWK_03159 [Rhodopirellula baltica SWK14]|uniref:Uncharacterized protein n=1 Tax=Rhodopirellula baltica SWK14 TaxID=993516 RepID=L7CH18_RHOBT|nr:hypothetical protein RBSWK_03159 [Rhodopirellula baltica SWK14]
MGSDDLTSSEILQGLVRRVETELHQDQSGFKAIAGFVSIDHALQVADGVRRPPEIADVDFGKDLANHLNEHNLVIDIAWSMIFQACENPDDPTHELAVAIQDRFETVREQSPDLLPEVSAYVVGGLEPGLAIIAAIDDRFWDHDELGPAGEVGATRRTKSPESHQAACEKVARHAYERNEEMSGVIVISGFLPHSPLLRMFPDLANPDEVQGPARSKFLAHQLQESGAISNVVIGLLQNVAADPSHPHASTSERILTQIKADLETDGEEYRKPLH